MRRLTPLSGGLRNTTYRLETADGATSVLQVLEEVTLAAGRVELARRLPGVLGDVGVPSPRLLDADPDGRPPWLLRQWVPGRPGSAVRTAAEGARLAAGTGRWLVALAAADPADLRLYRAWGRPQALEGLVSRWLALLALPDDVAEDLTADAALARREARPAVLAHGDCSPRNTVVAGDGTPLALIDVEFARWADPRFDAAWWQVVAALDDPGRAGMLRTTLRAAAGLGADDAAVEGALGRLRLLEVAVHTGRRGDEGASAWRRRLSAAVRAHREARTGPRAVQRRHAGA